LTRRRLLRRAGATLGATSVYGCLYADQEAIELVLEALQDVVADDETLTKDLGGDAGTDGFGETVAERVREMG